MMGPNDCECVPMIIDCHGHYTTAPKALGDYRDQQKADLKKNSQAQAVKGEIKISDDANGGMLLRPYVTVSTAKSTVGTVVSGLPPPCPPLPSSPCAVPTSRLPAEYATT